MVFKKNLWQCVLTKFSDRSDCYYGSSLQVVMQSYQPAAPLPDSTFRKKKEQKERLFQFLVSAIAGWTHFTEEILTKSIMHNMGAFSEKRKTPNIDTCNLQDKIPAVKLTALSGLCCLGLHERQPVWNTATNGRDTKQTTLLSINYFSYSNLLPSGIMMCASATGCLSLQTRWKKKSDAECKSSEWMSH